MLNMMNSTFTYFSAHDIISFPLWLNKVCVCVCTRVHNILKIHWSIKENLRKCLLPHIGVEVSLLCSDLDSFESVTRNGAAGSYCSYIYFLRPWVLIAMVFGLIYIPTIWVHIMFPLIPCVLTPAFGLCVLFVCWQTLSITSGTGRHPHLHSSVTLRV